MSAVGFIYAPGDGWRHGRGLPGLVPLLRWCRLNVRQTHWLQRCGNHVLRIGEEQVALSPEQTLSRICEWLDIAWEEKRCWFRLKIHQVIFFPEIAWVSMRRSGCHLTQLSLEAVPL